MGDAKKEGDIDSIDDALPPLRERMERINERIRGETSYLDSLARQVADHKKHHPLFVNTERKP